MLMLKLFSAFAGACLYVVYALIPEPTFQALVDGSLLTEMLSIYAGIGLSAVLGYWLAGTISDLTIGVRIPTLINK